MVDTSALARRKFGKADLTVPPIAIGCAPIGNMPDTFGYGVSDEDAVATIKAILASPIDYIDTAALYGDGESERRVGLALRELGSLPEGAILQTKAGRAPTTDDFSGETVKRRFERSLQLLDVDNVQIVYLHDPEWTTLDEAMAPGGPVEVLRNYQQQGVIQYLGVAGGPIAVETQYIETGIFDALITHNRYSLLNQSADGLIELAASKGIAVLNAAPYGSGMLAKGAGAYPRYAYQQASPELIDRFTVLTEIADRYGVPLQAVALQFSTKDPRITSTIVGMSKPERVQQTIDYHLVEIPDGLWAEVRALPKIENDPEEHRWDHLERRPKS
jgi:D-threo-aldose 1-dehydrogenase